MRWPSRWGDFGSREALCVLLVVAMVSGVTVSPSAASSSTAARLPAV